MSEEDQQALRVLRGIWSANHQTSAELDAAFGSEEPKVCKNMKDIGFGGFVRDAVPEGEAGTNTPVDSDLRSAWRARLEREGKLHPDGVSVRELVLGPDQTD